MARVTLVRHAQASLGSANYDQLSELGFRQAELLGLHFKRKNKDFNRVITGELTRHHQTAEKITSALDIKNEAQTATANWDEFDFKTLVTAYISSNITTQANPPKSKKGYFVALKSAMKAWQQGALNPEGMETWDSFEQRIQTEIDDFFNAEREEEILVVSSGGAIALVLARLHGLSGDVMIDLNLQIKNTAYTEIDVKKDRLVLASFNNTPHLDSLYEENLVTYA